MLYKFGHKNNETGAVTFYLNNSKNHL